MVVDRAASLKYFLFLWNTMSTTTMAQRTTKSEFAYVQDRKANARFKDIHNESTYSGLLVSLYININIYDLKWSLEIFNASI